MLTQHLQDFSFGSILKWCFSFWSCCTSNPSHLQTETSLPASENPTASTLLFNLFSIPIHLTILMCAKNYLELQELDGTLVVPISVVFDPAPLFCLMFYSCCINLPKNFIHFSLKVRAPRLLVEMFSFDDVFFDTDNFFFFNDVGDFEISDNAGPAPKIKDEAVPEAEDTIRFDYPDSNTHDVVINGKGRKFYCVKMTLAKHSPHFYDLFFKDPKHTGQKEVLMILHGVNKSNNDVVSRVLGMSKLWDCGVALQQCGDFLAKS
ncbi:hypothetical protein CAEBREN_23503 [Caenorhabditis brenneri]|uniref:BTB domain-containing protein n=1 Tax=Caenorhabditis brenneri TaxID=135651 RepID=G0P154_CAEBE|nr:hypothetical protein CAEBREN_23503 [Caenorhabditis brenneri]